MSVPLEYQRLPSPPRVGRAVAILAPIYPLLALGALYGEWLLGWAALGHAPQPSMDDPKDILGGVAHGVTGLLLLGGLPSVFVGSVFNFMWLMDRRATAIGGMLRLLALWGLWGGAIALLLWDPMKVGYWWLD